MNKSRLLAAATLLLMAAAAPSSAEARHHHRHYGYHDWYALPYPISYLHNYGPGPAPGTFAYYDGPSTNYCYQGSAAYIGQDHMRHPCF